MEKVAYSYVRFSTKTQLKGDSLARQLAKARDYAHRNGLLLDESSYQDLGISAFKGRNATDGALKAFLDAVDAGTIPPNTTLLIENFDRLSRAEVSDALDLFLSITKRGVTIVTLSDEQVYNRRTINANWTKLIISLATMSRAHEESAIKSTRVRSGKLAALAEGKKHGKCPMWLELNADKRSFRIREEKAEIVRIAFAMRAEGIGSLRIARHLNETFSMRWGSPQVARLLQNPAVVGTRISQAGYEPLIDHYPPIISKALFYEVARLMSSPSLGTRRGRRPNDEPNLFTGLARCGCCGGALRFFRENKNVSQRYLRCYAAVSGAGCGAGYVNYDAFENEVIGWLLLDQDDELIPLLDKKPNSKATSTAEVLALKEQQARLLDLVTAGLINTRLVTEKLNGLELQIKDCEAALLLERDGGDRLFAVDCHRKLTRLTH